ncbi:hypothetical protein IE81DRAFT_350200 [Ceraceosorus guamensis]|uniref:Uncharacterized protein n=1 Tax=Ceraceosorus guamensis TaxID=1522189 RepID=A0A316VPC0_9BASI|nr:hypothetical protein IE81DRAFT_350200 [Ceraceosorus guamensis]PWN39417.1 hypothetical protein IE81DRAFT_350200 [Ceraceosorus guamensis]
MSPLMLLYWWSRATSFGLSSAALVLEIVRQAVSDFSDLRVRFSSSTGSGSGTTSSYMWSPFEELVEAVLLALAAFSFHSLQCLATFRISFRPWRQSKAAKWNELHQRIPATAGLLGRRKPLESEKGVEKLDVSNTQAVSLALGLLLLHAIVGNIDFAQAIHHPEGLPTSELTSQVSGHFSNTAAREAWPWRLELLSTSCVEAAMISPLLLNTKTATYNGSFRIVSVSKAVHLLLNWLYSALASKRSVPYTTRCLLSDGIILLECVQAVAYRGVGQELVGAWLKSRGRIAPVDAAAQAR